jgi:hypothetical protein
MFTTPVKRVRNERWYTDAPTKRARDESLYSDVPTKRARNDPSYNDVPTKRARDDPSYNDVPTKRARDEPSYADVPTERAAHKRYTDDGKVQSLDDIIIPSVSYYVCTRPCPKLAHCDVIKTIPTMCQDGFLFDKIVMCLCGHCKAPCESTFIFTSSINKFSEGLSEFLYLLVGAENREGYDYDCLNVDLRPMDMFLAYIGCKKQCLMYKEAFMQYKSISITTRASCYGTPQYNILTKIAGRVSKGFSVHDCPDDLKMTMLNFISHPYCHTLKDQSSILLCGGKHGIVELLDNLGELNGIAYGPYAAAVSQKDNEKAQEMLLPSDMIDVHIYHQKRETWHTLSKWAEKYNYKTTSANDNCFVFLHDDSRTVRVTYNDQSHGGRHNDINYFDVYMKSSQKVVFKHNTLKDWTNRRLTYVLYGSRRPLLEFLVDVSIRRNNAQQKDELKRFYDLSTIDALTNRLSNCYPLMSDNDQILWKEHGLRIVEGSKISLPTKVEKKKGHSSSRRRLNHDCPYLERYCAF